MILSGAFSNQKSHDVTNHIVNDVTNEIADDVTIDLTKYATNELRNGVINAKLLLTDRLNVFQTNISEKEIHNEKNLITHRK